MIKVRNKKIGVLNWILRIVIVVYIFGWILWTKQQHLEKIEPTGAMRVTAKAV
jgi:hypothetical protein